MENTVCNDGKNKKAAGGIKIYAAIITLCFVSAATLLVYMLIDKAKKEGEAVAVDGDTVINTADYISAAQAAELVENEHELAYAKGYDKSRAELLDMIKDRMSGGDTTLSMLRELFPQYLIHNDTNGFVFGEILDLPKNSFKKGDFWMDTEAGELKYTGDKDIAIHKTIDVSKFQGKIDWDKVKADGVEYVFIRVGIRGYGSGALVEDEYFKENIEGAKKAGIKTGVYMFSEAINEEEAREEARFVLERIKDYDIELPVVLDIEDIAGEDGRNEALSKEELTRVCRVFFDEVKKEGYNTMLYGNIKCLVTMVDLKELKDIDIWYAFYNDDIYIPYEVAGWQYASDGKVDGISGNCDLNIFFKEWD